MQIAKQWPDDLVKSATLPRQRTNTVATQARSAHLQRYLPRPYIAIGGNHMTMQDPTLPAGHPKQIYFENLSNSNETVTWYTTEQGPEVLAKYVLDLLALQPSQLHLFGEGAAEASDESLVMSLVAGAPDGAAMTVWVRSDTGVQRVNGGLTREHDEMMAGMSRGTYSGNAAQAWAVPLQFGRPKDSSTFDDLFAIMNSGAVVPAATWGATERPAEDSEESESIGITSEIAQACVTSVLTFLRENQHEQPLDALPFWITDEGLYVGVNENSIKIGFVARDQLALTPGAVESAAKVCRGLRAGHVWLSAGSDENNWCLIWGLKVPLMWLTEETCQQMLYTSIVSQEGIQETLNEQFVEHGGGTFKVDSENRGAAMLVIQSHM